MAQKQKFLRFEPYVAVSNEKYKLFRRLLSFCYKKPYRFRVERDNWSDMAYTTLVVEFQFKKSTNSTEIDKLLRGGIKV